MKNIFFLALIISFISVGCMFGGKRIKGNGNIKTEQRNVSAFDEVEVQGAISLYLTQGEAKPVQLESDENLLQYVELVQQGDKLEVRTRSGFNLDPTEEVKVYLSAPQYKRVEVSGACNITGQNKLTCNDNFEVGLSGAGKINLEVDAPEVKTDLSGSSDINLKGETKRFELELSGAGQAHCSELKAEEVVVQVSGAGDADVYASRQLDVNVSGAGHVKYKGDVKNINQKVSGAGSVEKMN